MANTQPIRHIIRLHVAPAPHGTRRPLPFLSLFPAAEAANPDAVGIRLLDGGDRGTPLEGCLSAYGLSAASVLLACHLFPRHPLTISPVIVPNKVGSTLRKNTGRRAFEQLRQQLFSDRAQGTHRCFSEITTSIVADPNCSNKGEIPGDDQSRKSYGCTQPSET